MRREDEEQRVMENIAMAIPLMSDFEKGYILGMVEAKRREKEQEKKKGASRHSARLTHEEVKK